MPLVHRGWDNPFQDRPDRPAIVKAKPPKPELAPVVYTEPLPRHKLGQLVKADTLLNWGGTTRVRNRVTGYDDYLDREGRFWQYSYKFKTHRLVDDGKGNQWEPENAIPIHAEGQQTIVAATDLVEAGFVDNGFCEAHGYTGLVHKKTGRAFLINGNTLHYHFHQIPPEAYAPVDGPFLTLDQARSGLYVGQKLYTCGDCKRPFLIDKDSGSCEMHAVCSECVAKGHLHCKSCKRHITLTEDPNIEPEYRHAYLACGKCNFCNHCRRVCVFCPPDEQGFSYCKTCCTGEHYNEPEEVLSPYIRPYNNKEFPPARPPMTGKDRTLCPDCKGQTSVRNGNGLWEGCVTCHASGFINNKAYQDLYLGVELEVEVPHGLAVAAERLAEDYKDSIILKADGTIRHGFEIVTAPLSLKEHESLWTVLAPTAVKHGCRSWNYTNTGLHIHTNRRFYTQDDICKLNVFINEPAVKDKIVKIAGRESYYAALKPKTIEDGKKRLVLPHREALNINPPSTIELRIFKGTLSVDHILADIQFMHAAAHWVKEAKTGELSNWETFWHYVTQLNRYPQLVAHFNRQEAIERANREQS